MKVIIAGSRSITSKQFVDLVMSLSRFKVTEVVSGGAKGIDTLGEAWAVERKIPVKRMPADWITYGKKAGVLRNQQMAEYADALVAIWDGASKGTAHMISYAKRKGIKTFVYSLFADGLD